MVSDVLFSSGSEEWETPAYIFDSLNKVFDFTLDAAANFKNTKCKKFYSIENSGLGKSWRGERVFLNPPYSKQKNVTDSWIEKAYGEFYEDESNQTVVVVLIAARTETKRWQRRIFPFARAICFLDKRVQFLRDGIKVGSPPFPSAIAVFKRKALTSNEKEVLREMGYVWER